MAGEGVIFVLLLSQSVEEPTDRALFLQGFSIGMFPNEKEPKKRCRVEILEQNRHCTPHRSYSQLFVRTKASIINFSQEKNQSKNGKTNHCGSVVCFGVGRKL